MRTSPLVPEFISPYRSDNVGALFFSREMKILIAQATLLSGSSEL
jgi:hypothetical protein